MKSRRSPLLCVLQRFFIIMDGVFSLGVAQEITPAIKLDFGYSYIVVNRMAINVVSGHPSSEQLLLPGLGQLNYFGAANLNVSVISAALRYQFGT